MNIRTLCLGILQFQNATGYEINKLVADGRFSHFIEASYGSIYPALTAMMQDGLVTCREEAQTGKPARKIYSITPEGRTELLEALKDTPQPNRFKSEFLFVGLFADLLPPEHMQEMIALQEQRLADKLEEMRGALDHCDHPGSRYALGEGIAAISAKLDHLRRNKHMLLPPPPQRQPNDKEDAL